MRELPVSYNEGTGRFFMRKINTILSVLIVVVLLPLIVTILYQSTQLEEIIDGKANLEVVVDEQLIGIVAN